MPTGPTTVVLTLAGLLMMGQMYTVIALFEPMAATFGVSTEAMTWTVTAFGLANAVGALVAGPLSDRLGARPVIVGGLAATALSTALVPAAPDLSICIELRAMQGFSVAFLVPASFSHVTSQVRPDRRALTLSCITSSALASAVVMQSGAQMISEALNWPAVFLICAPLLLLAAVVARTTLRPSRSDSGPSLADAFTALPELLTRASIVALCAATMTLLGGFVAILTAITLVGPAHLANDHDALLVLRASALPAMIAAPLVTPLLAYLTANTRIVGGLGLAVAAAVGASLVGTSTMGLSIMLLVFAAAILVAAPALVQALSDAASPNRGAAAALYAFFFFGRQHRPPDRARVGRAPFQRRPAGRRDDHRSRRGAGLCHSIATINFATLIVIGRACWARPRDNPNMKAARAAIAASPRATRTRRRPFRFMNAAPAPDATWRSGIGAASRLRAPMFPRRQKVARARPAQG